MFEVICTSDLEMVTWKPISIEAIKVFITSLNQLCTVISVNVESKSIFVGAGLKADVKL